MLGRYLLIAGTVRFAIEFVRVNEQVLFGLTVAHLVSLVLMIAGALMVAWPNAPVTTTERVPAAKLRRQ